MGLLPQDVTRAQGQDLGDRCWRVPPPPSLSLPAALLPPHSPSPTDTRHPTWTDPPRNAKMRRLLAKRVTIRGSKIPLQSSAASRGLAAGCCAVAAKSPLKKESPGTARPRCIPCGRSDTPASRDGGHTDAPSLTGESQGNESSPLHRHL